MECVGVAGDGRAAAELARTLMPDVVMMDVSMPELNGLKATQKIKQVCPPEVKVLMLTRHTEEGYLQELIRAGANGYVLKQSSSAELLAAIRAVAAGNSYLDQSLTGRVMDAYAGRQRAAPGAAATAAPAGKELSEREADVLRLIAWGYGNKEIGDRLSISVKTVDVHKANALRKLGLKGRVDIVRFALLQGWLTET
jgi:DNA-binding NarL/FixJ family response regulator